MHALLVTHSLTGVTHAEQAELTEQLAPALDAVSGLVARTPLENTVRNCYGALYVFEARSAFDRFVASELYAAVYGRDGIHALEALDFAVPQARVPA